MLDIKHIVALQIPDRGIGNAGDLLWKLPNDRGWFRRTTRHHVVLMGRKTFESIGSKPLKERINIVVSKRLASMPSCADKVDVILVSSIEDGIHLCEQKYPHLTLFVIGGTGIFEATMPRASQLLVTEVQPRDSESRMADTFYPIIPAYFTVSSASPWTEHTDETGAIVRVRVVYYNHK